MDRVSEAALKTMVAVSVAVAAALGSVGLHSEGAQDPMEHRIVKRAPQSELQQFASWFHQDWKLLFGDVQSAARIYLDSVSEVRRVQLRKELAEFLNATTNGSNEELLKSWYSLGAQGWQMNTDIRQVLGEIAKGSV